MYRRLSARPLAGTPASPARRSWRWWWFSPHRSVRPAAITRRVRSRFPGRRRPQPAGGATMPRTRPEQGGHRGAPGVLAQRLLQQLLGQAAVDPPPHQLAAQRTASARDRRPVARAGPVLAAPTHSRLRSSSTTRRRSASTTRRRAASSPAMAAIRWPSGVRFVSGAASRSPRSPARPSRPPTSRVSTMTASAPSAAFTASRAERGSAARKVRHLVTHAAWLQGLDERSMVPAGSTAVPGTSSRAVMTHRSATKREAKSNSGRRRSDGAMITAGRPLRHQAGDPALQAAMKRRAMLTSGARVASPSLWPRLLRSGLLAGAVQGQGVDHALGVGHPGGDLAEQPPAHLLDQEPGVLAAGGGVGDPLEDACAGRGSTGPRAAGRAPPAPARPG